MENPAVPPQVSRMSTLRISMNEEEIGLGVVYVGDTELRACAELTPISKSAKSGAFPFRNRLDRVLEVTIDRNEENIDKIERALEGSDVSCVTFYLFSMKLIPDLDRVLRGMRAKAVTIYQQQIEQAEMCNQFADVVFALKSVDDFQVDITFREYSEHASLLISLLTERAHKVKVEIQTWDKTEEKFSSDISTSISQLVSQSSPNVRLFLDNQFAPLHSESIDFNELCKASNMVDSNRTERILQKMETAQTRRRVIFHVDKAPMEIERSGSVKFKVVPFQSTFVVHIDSTGTDCDCYACAVREREEEEARV